MNESSVTNHVMHHVTNNTKISISTLEKVCEFHKNLCKLVEENNNAFINYTASFFKNNTQRISISLTLNGEEKILSVSMDKSNCSAKLNSETLSNSLMNNLFTNIEKEINHG
ncbi:MAG: hypothetical protein KAH01_07755 [Caldisericia bacterium]|nr:hypothetical protein [Caldisericia bacterium]